MSSLSKGPERPACLTQEPGGGLEGGAEGRKVVAVDLPRREAGSRGSVRVPESLDLTGRLGKTASESVSESWGVNGSETQKRGASRWL